MSRVMCDVMDCKHMVPIERAKGGEPFFGLCGARLVNIFGDDERRCITYKASEGDEDEQRGTVSTPSIGVNLPRTDK